MPRKLLGPDENGERYELYCPVSMPDAAGFLWNRHMVMQLNCRGYVVAQHMQPEPAKYSHPPMLERKTFLQPEQPHFAHHPGRFVYVKDESSGRFFSVPHEPVRRPAQNFVFSVGRSGVRWQVDNDDLAVILSVSLPADDVVELWTLHVRNTGNVERRISVYPYFTIGYMSWMNQSARYDAGLGAIVARSITPYQKLEDYPGVKALKDITFLAHDRHADAWECSLAALEGEGGLHDPDSIRAAMLDKGDAIYETPAAALQYRLQMPPHGQECLRFLFGPAHDHAEIGLLRDRYLKEGGFENARRAYDTYLSRATGCLGIDTPDRNFDHFVNHWLGRQVYYHGAANRLTTDPQTRNFLQDAMGMIYVDAEVAKDALLRAFSQQKADGNMPEGIVLNSHARLKYINEVPHTDHCVWLPICCAAYLDETADWSLLDRPVASSTDRSSASVFDRMAAALRWLVRNRDARGLSLIAQGDWCDPMNMVGHKGHGVSGWLSMATVYALKLWAEVCEQYGDRALCSEFRSVADDIGAAVRRYLWDGEWFARGITDDGVPFGVSDDEEGSIYLNPQSWSVLADIADDRQQDKILDAVGQRLETRYGAMLLAPAYTAMREDIGRVTQKHPGSAENGSIYNHAAMFYVLALYHLGEADRAYEQLRRILPGPDEEDYLRRGQLPVFVPNYYRGAVHQYPRTAGRSSQLFHTGAASWLYRIVVERLFGLRGNRDGLRVEPQLPSTWNEASVKRRFRGAEFAVRYRRDADAERIRVSLDGEQLDDVVIRNAVSGRRYTIDVVLPMVVK